MKLLKPTLLFIICNLAVTCFSQAPKKTFSLAVAPTLLAPPTKRLGAEAAIQYGQGQWAVNAQIGLPFEKWYDEFARIRYARLGMEVLRYKRNATWARPYAGVRLNYTIRQMVDTNGSTYASKEPPGIYYYNKASISSPIFAVALKGGFEFLLSKRLFLDYSSGAGIRIITTTYKNVEQPTPSQFNEPADCCAFRPSYQYEGRYTKFHRSGGLRLGYRLWREGE